MSGDLSVRLRDLEQRHQQVRRHWAECRDHLFLLAARLAEHDDGASEGLEQAVRAHIADCDAAQALLLEIDRERRAILGRENDRDHVGEALVANRASWLASTRLKLLRRGQGFEGAVRVRFDLVAATIRAYEELPEPE